MSSTNKSSLTDHSRKSGVVRCGEKESGGALTLDVLLISGASTLNGKLIRQALEPIRLDLEPPGAAP